MQRTWAASIAGLTTSFCGAGCLASRSPTCLVASAFRFRVRIAKPWTRVRGSLAGFGFGCFGLDDPRVRDGVRDLLWLRGADQRPKEPGRERRLQRALDADVLSGADDLGRRLRVAPHAERAEVGVLVCAAEAEWDDVVDLVAHEGVVAAHADAGAVLALQDHVDHACGGDRRLLVELFSISMVKVTPWLAPV